MKTPSSFAPHRLHNRPSAPSTAGLLARVGSALYAALRASALSRARSEMLSAAGRCERLQPQLAAELRGASAHLVGY